jgi:energy-converting hydrogenase A subunit R
LEIACFLDCEGPISKNDNAFEMTSHFIPNGDKVFKVISKYDDILSTTIKRQNYQAGDTLKLILPFLKAYCVSDQKMNEFSTKTLNLMNNIQKTLKYLMNIAATFIVSTSYEHYIKAICKTVNFPFNNTYCTKVKISKYSLSHKENSQLRQFSKEIAKMNLSETFLELRGLSDFSTRDERVVQRLDDIFWREIPQMSVNKILTDVKPIGGKEKALAIRDGINQKNIPLENVVYIGDSITDSEAFQLVKNNNGLTIAFNGNNYAIENAEVAVMSKTSLIIAIIVEIFSRFGKKSVMNLINSWNWKTLKRIGVNEQLLEELAKECKQHLPLVEIISKDNVKTIIEKSVNLRKRIRGEAIGKLG